MAKVERYAERMRSGSWDWAKMKDPIIIDSEGNIVSGHHRIMAAQKAGVQIPRAVVRTMPYKTSRPVHTWEEVLPEEKE